MLQVDFLEAVVSGDSQRVVLLLGQITDTEAGPIKDGRNALHLAAHHGNADVVTALLLSGLFDCHTRDSSGYTALQIAAAQGHLEIVKQLIKSGSDANAADNEHGNTALHEAAWKGYSLSVAELARTGANLNAKNWGGFTPLHLCCQNGHNQSCRELLLAGCDADLQNNYGDTPLHTSARYGHAGVMRILISAQCRVSDQNKNGDTALHIAAAMNRRKLTRILLESNCDKNIANKQNETAQHIAARKSHYEILEILASTSRSRTKPKAENGTAARAQALESQVKAKSKEKGGGGKNRSSVKRAAPAQAVAPGTRNSAVAWSPYGCHYYPDSADFPEPNLDSLPNEPLSKGEQYFLDLAGNIRKGPVGVGYACYCAPFFHQLETRIERKTKKIQKRICRTEDAINKRLDTIEYRLAARNRWSSTGESAAPDADRLRAAAAGRPRRSLGRTRSLESIFDADATTARCSGERTTGGLPSADTDGEGAAEPQPRRSSECGASPARYRRPDDAITTCPGYAAGQPHFSTGSPHDHPSDDVWCGSRLAQGDSCESSDEECDKAADIPCDDSGYSTKMCSNSQGPSPSLSGRLDNDGLLSVTSSQLEKRGADPNSFVSTGAGTFRNVSVKRASIV